MAVINTIWVTWCILAAVGYMIGICPDRKKYQGISIPKWFSTLLVFHLISVFAGFIYIIAIAGLYILG